MSNMNQEAIARMYGIAWLLRNGYEVYPNVCFNGAVDVMAVKNGVVELFDIKSDIRRNGGGGARGTQIRTDEQVARGVKFLWVQGENNCFVSESNRKPTTQIEIDWDCQLRLDGLDTVTVNRENVVKLKLPA